MHNDAQGTPVVLQHKLTCIQIESCARPLGHSSAAQRPTAAATIVSSMVPAPYTVSTVRADIGLTATPTQDSKFRHINQPGRCACFDARYSSSSRDSTIQLLTTPSVAKQELAKAKSNADDCRIQSVGYYPLADLDLQPIDVRGSQRLLCRTEGKPARAVRVGAERVHGPVFTAL